MNSRGKNKKSLDSESNIANKKKKSDKFLGPLTNDRGDGVDIFGDSTLNNSKTHPALRLSDNSLHISPQRKKSFMVFIPNLIDEDGLLLNDDEAEIREEKKRKELELQKEKENASLEKDSLATLNFSIRSHMSAAELKEHVMQCVKLSTENCITISKKSTILLLKESFVEEFSSAIKTRKVNLAAFAKNNHKNAFALQLIDCMAYMMKKDNSNNDFSTMACTLDASAKIYSVRVDSICNDMSKLLDAFLASRKKPSKKSKDEDESDDDTSNAQNTPKVHRFQKNRKNPSLASKESLKAKPVEKNFLRNYMKLEVGIGAFISTSIWDPVIRQPSLEKGIPFLSNFKEQSEDVCNVVMTDFFSQSEIEVVAVTEKDDDSNIGIEELFVETEKLDVLNRVPENTVDAGPMNEEMLAQNSNDEDLDFHDNDDDDDMPLDNESLHEECIPDSENNINCVPDVIKQMDLDDNGIDDGFNQTRRTEKLQAMFNKGNSTSEYSYLEQTYSPVWTGPDYWKKSYKGRIIAHNKKGGKKKKGPIPLMFDTSPIKDLKSTVPQKLSRKTMLNWKEKKVTVPEVIPIDPNLFVRSFFRPKDKSFIYKLGKQASYLLSDDLNRSNTAGDTTTYSQDLMAITDDPKAILDDDFDNGIGSPSHADDESFESQTENMQNDGHPIAVEAGTSKDHNSDLLDGSNLIPVPKLVAVQEIKYATRPNNVDMKELKKDLLDILAFDNQNKENKGPLTEDVNMKFSEVYRRLTVSLPGDDEERGISPSMAFLAVLHLANENNFTLQYPHGDSSDFVIAPET